MHHSLPTASDGGKRRNSTQRAQVTVYSVNSGSTFALNPVTLEFCLGGQAKGMRMHETASGTNWSNRLTYQVFIINIRVTAFSTNWSNI